MNKRGRVLLALILGVVVAAAFTLAWAKAQAPDKDIVIQYKEEEIGSAQKSPVTFSHAKHKEAKCTACHHKEKEDAEKIQKCSQCHKAKDEGDTPKLKDSFHIEKNKKTEKEVTSSCVGCHKALKKQDKKTGPTACTKCHPKKEGEK